MSTKLAHSEEDAPHMSTQVVPHLQEFLSSVPTPLIKVLVGLSPHIKWIRRTLEILSWKSKWEESWLALAAWWMLCLGAGVTLRYLTPLVLLIALYYYQRIPPAQPPTITEQQLRQTIASLTVIHDLLHVSRPTDPSPTQWSHFPSLRTFAYRPLLRATLAVYPAYLIATYFIPLRVLIAIAGTVILTWRAGWAGIVRKTLWRSAHFRWACYRLYSVLSGEPLPPTITPTASTDFKVSSTREGPEKDMTMTSLRFLFTLHENQRWWISLDWTSALLPAERPPWSSPPPNFIVLSPPSSFTLPPDTVVYQDFEDPSPNKGSDKKRRRVKRQAHWTWEEPEWKVIIKQEGTSVQRQERDLPVEGSTSTTSASKLLKGVVNHRREGSSGKEDVDIELAEQQKRVKNEIAQAEGHEHEGGVQHEEEAVDEPYTDADGWVYGDNKWENQSAKGGMGKYTRYRRWTRIALLIETIEPVGENEVDPSYDAASSDSRTEVTSLPEKHADDVQKVTASRRDTSMSAASVEEEDHGSLRQRLKAAVRRTSIAH
ncbi:hypothetical protein OE88DRAFT_1655577 [Heliocybe sulcata]|uniref:TECPR1-like DysF domain-containing protein n=1 Tax=Heliocybe sulcata TaxID=5364 RepID=A0A5C3N7Z1_9AGAM|nr:hypothetical protein OE88DRAFT_1655577 [Heliocybe sulcata]